MAIKKKEAERSYDGIPVKTEKVSEELSCQLTELEWQNRANEMAAAQEKAEAEEQRKKDVTKQLGADLAVAKGRVSKLANIVATRREQREVIVEVVYDYEKGLVVKTRTDLNEVISSREMTTTERQSGLFDNEAVSANDLIESRHEDTNNNNSEEE